MYPKGQLHINWFIDAKQVPLFLQGLELQTLIWIEQSEPWKPNKHEHAYWFKELEQVAPFLQGNDRHVFNIWLQVAPVQPLFKKKYSFIVETS